MRCNFHSEPNSAKLAYSVAKNAVIVSEEIVTTPKYVSDDASQEDSGNGQPHVVELPTTWLKIRPVYNLLPELKSYDLLFTSSTFLQTGNNEAGRST